MSQNRPDLSVIRHFSNDATATIAAFIIQGILSLLLAACHSKASKGVSERLDRISTLVTERASCSRLVNEYEEHLRVVPPTEAESDIDFKSKFDPEKHACYLEKLEVAGTDFWRQRTREVFDAQQHRMIVGCFQSSNNGQGANIFCLSGITGLSLKPADARRTLNDLMSEQDAWPSQGGE